METEITFSGELRKLIDLLKEITLNDIKHYRGVMKYEEALGKSPIEVHQRYFERLLKDNVFNITTEMAVGEWLETGNHSIVFGKGKAGALLSLSEIYRATKSRAAKPQAVATIPKLPIYCRAILLHLYRIFTIIEPNETIENRWKIIQQDLRNGPQPSMMQSVVGPILDLIKSVAPNMAPEHQKMLDAVANVAKSDSLAETMSQLGGHMSSLATLVPKLLPKVISGITDIQSGTGDVSSLLAGLVADEDVRSQLSKMDGLKPLLIETAQSLQASGTDMSEILNPDMMNLPLGEFVQKLINAPDTQQELTAFNSQATALMKNPDMFKKLVAVGQTLTGNQPARDDLGLASLSGPARPPPARSAPITDLSQLQRSLSALTPEQMAALSQMMAASQLMKQ